MGGLLHLATMGDFSLYPRRDQKLEIPPVFEEEAEDGNPARAIPRFLRGLHLHGLPVGRDGHFGRDLAVETKRCCFV